MPALKANYKKSATADDADSKSQIQIAQIQASSAGPLDGRFSDNILAYPSSSSPADPKCGVLITQSVQSA
jgi:hypothetical protein